MGPWRGLWVALFVGLGVSVGCERTWQGSLDNPVAAASFADDFESGSLDRWGVEGNARNRSELAVDPAGGANRVVSMRVEPGVLVNNGNRAEITYDNRDVPGTIGWYRWRFFVPTDYGEPHDTTGKDGEGRSLWQIMGQWHDQPDVAAGETWATYPAHSPPIAVHYGTLEGQSKLVVYVGVEGDVKGLGPIDLGKGEWHDVVFHIGWSPGEDGFVAVWIDGEPLTTFTDGTPVPLTDGEPRALGRNMYNAVPHYLKLGLYRNPTLPHTNTVYYDDVVISANRDG